jgi:hypothetical protein
MGSSLGKPLNAGLACPEAKYTIGWISRSGEEHIVAAEGINIDAEKRQSTAK